MIHVSGFNNGVGGSPGATSAKGSGLRKPRPRSVYTSEQIQHFETFFRINEYIDGERKRKLSQLTTIPEHKIKVWFQNRRQKKKHQENFEKGVEDSICQLCPLPEDQKVDKMSETLLKLKTLKFKCRHCSASYFREDIKIHESGCDQRLVLCPYANFVGFEPYKCDQMVNLNNILLHCELVHHKIPVPSMSGQTITVRITDEMKEAKSLVLFPAKIEAYGKVFIRSAVTRDGIFYEWVTLIGSPLEAKEFTFRLDYKGSKSVFVYFGRVATMDETLDSIITSGKCSCIGFEPFKNQFMKGNTSHSSRVTIKKKNYTSGSSGS